MLYAYEPFSFLSVEFAAFVWRVSDGPPGIAVLAACGLVPRAPRGRWLDIGAESRSDSDGEGGCDCAIVRRSVARVRRERLGA